jgi:cobalt-zinc-cadmium efflux system outer membrane protein
MFCRIFSVIFFIGALSFPIQEIHAQSAESKGKGEHSPLTLEEAVEATLQKNPELKAMEKDVDATHAKVPQARSWDDPMVGVRFYQVPFNGGIDDAMDIDYIVSQKIPFPGKKKAYSQIAYHEYLHHIELLGERGRELLRDVKTTYYSLFSVNRLIGTSREIENLLKGVIQSAQAKLAANQAMATDSIQGQVELAKVLFERQSLVERKKGLEAKLNQLMARSSDEEIHLPLKLEIPRWNAKLEEILEIAQQKHPSVKLATHDIDQKKWAVKAAKREYIPDLNAQLEYVQRPGPAENAWTGEFMLNIPLLVKKKGKAVEQAEAELASAQYSQVAAKNDVSSKVKEVYAKMKAADRMLALNRNTLLPQTRQALEVTSSAYTTGKSDFISYLTSARSLSDAQMEYWKSYEALASSVYELEEAVGVTREEWEGKKLEISPSPPPSPSRGEGAHLPPSPSTGEGRGEGENKGKSL